jgi:hypothetical protein
MDPCTFDRWTMTVARHSTRRTTVRLLTGGLLGGLLARRGSPARAAQRSDRDGDGLFDDDEVNVYGTNPDLYDSDGDGSGDGEEVYLGTDPRMPGAATPRADRDGDGLYDDDERNVYGTNPDIYDSDGDGVGDGEEVYVGANPLIPGGPIGPTGPTGPTGPPPPPLIPVPGVDIIG